MSGYRLQLQGMLTYYTWLISISISSVVNGICQPSTCDNGIPVMSPWYECENGSHLFCNEASDLTSNQSYKFPNWKPFNGLQLRCSMGQSLSEANISEADLLDPGWMRIVRIEKCGLKKFKVDVPREGFFELSLHDNSIETFLKLDINVYIDAFPILSVDLSKNSLRRVSRLMELTHFWVTRVKYLNLEHNKLTSLLPDVFRYLPRWADYINLSHNRITWLPKLGLENCTFGFTLLFHDNLIEGISDSAFQWMKIKVLDLSNNSLTEIHEEFFAGVLYIRELVLSGNSISYVENSAFDIPALESLTMRNNKLAVVPGEVFSSLPYLRTLDLSHNGITPIEYGAFAGLRLRLLDLSHNPLLEFPGKAFAQTSISILNLSDCLLGRFPTEAVVRLSRSLRQLDLSWNMIHNFPGPWDDPTLPRSTAVSILDMSHNGVYTFNCSILRSPFPLLTRLYLHGNSLRTIDECIGLVKLKVTLRENHLDCCELIWLKTLHFLIGMISDAGQLWCTWPARTKFMDGDVDFSYVCSGQASIPDAEAMQKAANGSHQSLSPLNLQSGVIASQTKDESVLKFENSSLQISKTERAAKSKKESILRKEIKDTIDRLHAEVLEEQNVPNYRQVAAANAKWEEMQRHLANSINDSRDGAKSIWRWVVPILVILVVLLLVVGMVLFSLLQG